MHVCVVSAYRGMDLRVSPPGGPPAVIHLHRHTHHAPVRSCSCACVARNTPAPAPAEAGLVHAHVLLAVRCREHRRAACLCAMCGVRVGARLRESFSLRLAPPRHRESAPTNATIRFYTWRRGHAEMQRFQAQLDTAHCSGSDADVGSAASAGTRTRPRVSTLAVHSPHATRHCSSVAQTARIFFAARTENPNCDTRTS